MILIIFDVNVWVFISILARRNRSWGIHTYADPYDMILIIFIVNVWIFVSILARRNISRRIHTYGSPYYMILIIFDVNVWVFISILARRNRSCRIHTRWFTYDRDICGLFQHKSVPVIFELSCTYAGPYDTILIIFGVNVWIFISILAKRNRSCRIHTYAGQCDRF